MEPFLLTHQVKGNLFDISSRLSPISIRDQMIRGYSVVSRAIDRKIIGPNKPLLVIGAGAAGATAAMLAANGGVPTTLLERNKRAFMVQLGSDSRTVDPTVYDWPAQYWEKEEFPPTATPLPLQWKKGISAIVAGVWEEKLLEEFHDNPNLTLVLGATLDKPEKLFKTYRATKPLIPIYFRTVGERRRRTGPHEFTMVISCIGQGSEKTEIGSFRGYSFWNEDPYSEKNLGLPDDVNPRVYISGGGDGALQDFLRIVTDKSAREIYEALPADLRKAAVEALTTCGDQYQRAFSWADPLHTDHTIQKSLHESYTATVNQLLLSYEKKLPDSLAPLIRANLETVTLAFGCNHFSHCYALNHFLALLLSLYLEKTTGKQVLRPNTRTHNIEGLDGHSCDKSPYECHSASHEVYFVPSDCDNKRESETPQTRLVGDGPYTVVIVRHGIDWIKPLLGDMPFNTQRHLLPYYLGW